MTEFDMWLASIVGLVYTICLIGQHYENKKLQAELKKAHLKNKIYKAVSKSVNWRQ